MWLWSGLLKSVVCGYFTTSYSFYSPSTTFVWQCLTYLVALDDKITWNNLFEIYCMKIKRLLQINTATNFFNATNLWCNFYFSVHDAINKSLTTVFRVNFGFNNFFLVKMTRWISILWLLYSNFLAYLPFFLRTYYSYLNFLFLTIFLIWCFFVYATGINNLVVPN